ncbi:hypothetical protein L6164_000511 [Bauhinia variegata]|uniref:Uncharacterized protein n=1 Tax=Bauhinia variegata TaxID=167791 RepID=A0ACB9Q5Z8_BAUVA|nr:hypothetical protein L6164_000511 [Bauhinia variegata]
MAFSAASLLLMNIASSSKSLTHLPFRNPKPYFLSPSPLARFFSSSLDNLEDSCQGLLPFYQGHGLHRNASSFSYLVVFLYGSAVLFNIKDHEVEDYLKLVKRHSSGWLQQMKKDGKFLSEEPIIFLKSLDPDGIRIIGSVLGQSIALDYFASQFNGLVEEFADISRQMKKTGTFIMDNKKLLRLVGKANSNFTDVILKVGLFDRSEIAWKDAKYAEMVQRIEILNFKVKFVEHNIRFLQDVLQNRKKNFLEWCIIGLLAIRPAISCMRFFVIQFVSA